VRVRVHSRVNTIADSDQSCCHCQVNILTLHKAANTRHGGAKNSAVDAAINLEAVDFLVDKNVGVLAVHNSDDKAFFNGLSVFYCDALVQVTYVFYTRCFLFVNSSTRLALALFLVYNRQKPVLQVLHVDFSTVSSLLVKICQARK